MAEAMEIYLQGAASFTLSKDHLQVAVYCSPHNLGRGGTPARRRVDKELNAAFAWLLATSAEKAVEGWTPNLTLELKTAQLTE